MKMMRRVRGLVAVFGSVLVGSVALPSFAANTVFYYDAMGRIIASTRQAAMDEYHGYDAADNRFSLNVDPQHDPSPNTYLYANESLNRFQTLTSSDGRFGLTVQNDGNVVLYENGSTALWATSTTGKQTAFLVMGADGNLAAYDAYLNVIWSTGTSGHPNAYLAVQSDGNLVIYSGNSAIWASGTSGH